MSDRGFLFLFSVVTIFASLGAAGWLLVTGQAGSVDGLFLLLTCLLIAFAFALYVAFLVRRAMESTKAATEPAKTAATAARSKPEPVAQS